MLLAVACYKFVTLLLEIEELKICFDLAGNRRFSSSHMFADYVEAMPVYRMILSIGIVYSETCEWRTTSNRDLMDRGKRRRIWLRKKKCLRACSLFSLGLDEPVVSGIRITRADESPRR